MRFVCTGLILLAAPLLAAASPVHLQLDATEVDSDGVASVSLVLARGVDVGGVQADLLFDSRALDLSRCKIGQAISASQAGCEEDPVIGPCKTLLQETDGGRARLMIAATAVLNRNPIPTDAVLATCVFTVIDSERLPVTILADKLVGATVDGSRLEAQANAVLLRAPVPTRLPESTPTATATRTAGVADDDERIYLETHGSPRSDLELGVIQLQGEAVANSSGVAAQARSGDGSSAGGCAVASPSPGAGVTWLWLAAVATMLWGRRAR